MGHVSRYFSTCLPELRVTLSYYLMKYGIIILRSCGPYHYSKITWASWRLKSATIHLFVKQQLHANNKENSKAPYNWLFVRGILQWPVVFSSQRTSNVESVSMSWRNHIPVMVTRQYTWYGWNMASIEIITSCKNTTKPAAKILQQFQFDVTTT